MGAITITEADTEAVEVAMYLRGLLEGTEFKLSSFSSRDAFTICADREYVECGAAMCKLLENYQAMRKAIG